MQFRIWVLCFLLFSSSVHRIANSLDPYKVLGVDRNANQRDVQKAFHKLSLKYHPDKNKEKNAETKFAEINNAYEILSDEQKRKNYDLYGDEKGAPNADFGSGGQQYHSYGGPQDGSTYSDGSFGQEFWFSNTQKGSNRQSFSVSFGNPSSRSSSSQFNVQGSGFPDFLFSILDEFFSGQTKHDSGYRESQNIQAINSKSFRSEVLDKGLTWLLLFYTPNTRDQVLESVVDEVAGSLRGGLKAGMVDCQDDWSLCKILGATPRDEPRIFIYSDGIAGKGFVVEYQGYSDPRHLKEFCQKNFPHHSKQISINDFDFSSSSGKPRVILLTNKKQTPLIWRALSGLYHNNMEFFHVEVSDTSGVIFGNLKLGKLPAIVGVFSNGVKDIIVEGWAAKDMNSAIDDIGKLLVEFQKKNAASANEKGKETETESGDQRVPLLTKSSVDELCGEHVAVCIVGVFKSSASKDKLESLLSTVSQKIMTRPGNSRHGLKNSVSYVLLDGNKQYKFIKSFDMKSSDKALLAYKPRKEKYAVFYGDLIEDKVEDFVTSVLNGDARFKKIERRTELK